MKSKFVDCFMLIGTALTLNNNEKLPGMGPPLLDNEGVLVNISLTIEDIQIKLDTLEIEVTSLLHQSWMDSRLGANSRTRKMAVAGQIWRPKITLIKGLIGGGVKEEDTAYWRGFGDEGNVLLSEKIIIKTFCTRLLKHFPFDTQICELKFGSYRFPIDEVKLMWEKNTPVDVLTEIDLNEFELTNISTYHAVDVRFSGNFSVLITQIYMKRNFLSFIICTVIPCIILVFISYLSLWLDFNSIGIRIGLSGAVEFYLLYFYKVVTCSIIATSFLKLIDVFIILCLTFTSFSLFGNCILSSIHGRICSNTAKVYDYTIKTKKIILWVERCIKLLYPILFIFCLIMFVYCT